MVVYDPNFRKSHLKDLPVVLPFILENMSLADIVRGSDEDFSSIFGANSPEEAYKFVKEFCPNMIYTASTAGVWLYTPNLILKFSVEKISPISTIGAGDSFNAGIIYSLHKLNLTKQEIRNLPANVWPSVIQQAIDFASHVCMSYDNYISEDFASSFC